MSADRDDLIVGLLRRILQKLDENGHELIDIRSELDSIDRALRPYGDGRREPRRRRP